MGSIKICAIAIVFLMFAPHLRAQTNNVAGGPATISSDTGYFDMNARTATYQGNVQVDDPAMHLRCEWLTATLPSSGGHINHIVCKTNVVIDALLNGQTNHITSDQAIYDYSVQAGVTNETITFTGNPRIENAQIITTGEPIIWNRTTDGIKAVNGKTIFKEGLSSFAPTNAPAKPQ